MKKEKVYDLLLFILMFIAVLATILIKPISDLDEIWNYNFARNIADGLIPYKDFNIVVTPLLSIICGIILKLTFNELIVMRILAALLCSTIMYITFKLFNLLHIRKDISIVFTFFIGYIFNDVLCIDYNYASLLLVLIIIYNEIKTYQKDLNFIKLDLTQDIILGVLAGLSIITKQTSGLTISIVLLGNKLLFVRKKEELKIYIKSFFFRLIGIIIPISIFVLYLILNNAFNEFISYTILGVLEFTNTIPYKILIHRDLIGILSVLVPIAFIYGWIKSVIVEKNKNMYFLTIYGLAIFVICFPISNKIHFLIGALPIIILILYESYNILKFIKGKININVKFKEFLILTIKYIIILYTIYWSLLNINKYFNLREEYSILNHYKYICISPNLEKQIENINQYINENMDVKILDAVAATYMIPINRYNKNYDMLNKGNLGANGEQKIIQEISQAKKIKYLILKERYGKNWQLPINIINYTKENKTKTGEIEIFDIYE